MSSPIRFFFFQAEDGIRDVAVTGVQTCALPISLDSFAPVSSSAPIGTALRNDSMARRRLPWSASIRSSECAASLDRKSTRLNSSHGYISYAVFCLKKKKQKKY